MRFRNVDFLKGILIFFVIIGHVLQGQISENLSRYLIYCFHMPLFIGISGFLVNYEKIGALSFRNLFNKYIFRVIIPWLIALVIYTVLANVPLITNVRGMLNALLKAILWPPYHLWFIPAYLGWVLLTWGAKKMNVSLRHLLFSSVPFSITLYIIEQHSSGFKGERPIDHLVQGILYLFRPFYFYVFFILGAYLRSNQFKISLMYNAIISILLFGGIVIQFYYPNNIADVVLFFFFNFSLLHFLIMCVKGDKLLHVSAIEWVGVNSLAIYLWHVAPLNILKHIIGTDNLLLFYILSIVGEILFILSIYLLSKNKIINKYILGVG